MGSVNLEGDDAKRRSDVIEWLNCLFPGFNLPLESTEDELRVRLFDGFVFLGILKMIDPCCSEEVGDYDPEKRFEYVIRLLAAAQKMGIPIFQVLDLEQGSMSSVVMCLLSLRDLLNSSNGNIRILKTISNSETCLVRSLRPPGDNLEIVDVQQGQHSSGEQDSFSLVEQTNQNHPQLKPPQPSLRSSISSEASTLSCHARQQFHEIFQIKQGQNSDLPAARISEMMKSNSLDSAPTQSLLNVMNSVLDECIERKTGEIPQRVACLLKKVVHEIECRISSQAEHIRNQIGLTNAREEKYKSRIRVLETLARGTSEESQILLDQLQLIKIEKIKIEESKKLRDQDLFKLVNEKETSSRKISELQQQLETTTKSCEQQCQLLEAKASVTKVELEEKIKELEFFLAESRKKTRELRDFSESKSQKWNQKQYIFQNIIGSQLQMMQNLKASSQFIKAELVNSNHRWSQELTNFGQNMKVLTDAAKNYHLVLAENRKLFNEIQELKGNIRVYCRIRPFLAGENINSMTIDYMSENGQLHLSNPSRQGKDSHRTFKFNKVFGPAATQEEVFLDIQPLIRSVLDGYNVCIFAYGQTGSGKTYTMTGPNLSAEEDWGVNYRALNDLFHISRNRRDAIMYEVGVQMVEIYNEQVRDLLKNDASQKNLGVLYTSQPNGLAVPDASMHPVNSTSDVLKLMQIGLANRAVGATALNERSSRSHCVVTVHVRGSDIKTGATLRASLHLVDLAGSERVDRSQATGDRLKEAQHINKSLSALGDVIFALSQKSSHVPYRNSKLTQVLQSSLGGQAKTLMFVQINPDVKSYSETFSTLKFAERVSGVELGAAQSSKESKDTRDLMQQVASLKNIVARKDEEIEDLQLLKDIRNQSPHVSERNDSNRLRHSSSSLDISLPGVHTFHDQRSSASRGTVCNAASNPGNSSDYSDKLSETSSQNSMDDNMHLEKNISLPKLAGEETSQSFPGDVEISGFADADSEERLSDISDGGFLVGGEADGSINGVTEFSLLPDPSKTVEVRKTKMPIVRSQISRPTSQKVVQPTLPRNKSNETLRSSSSRRSTSSQATTSSTKKTKR